VFASKYFLETAAAAGKDKKCGSGSVDKTREY
jgi:hypothetical protein